MLLPCGERFVFLKRPKWGGLYFYRGEIKIQGRGGGWIKQKVKTFLGEGAFSIFPEGEGSNRRGFICKKHPIRGLNIKRGDI